MNTSAKRFQKGIHVPGGRFVCKKELCLQEVKHNLKGEETMKTRLFVKVAVTVVACFVLVPSVHSQPLEISVETEQHDQCETAIAIDPLDPTLLMAVWKDYRNGYSQPGYAFSTDGGSNWTTSGIINIEGIDVSCAFDLDNHAFYCFTGQEGGPAKVARTTNFGGD
jgi:hypothetical protein